ncbi:hypothetical protein PIB30_049126 [Stylosanthes scabra]|uniref:Uncharacterized protein n=1 Tax=Stylosanthes scabra TaxID=79078 RepID=A0ABU6WHM0_9FABA|nr:hypothetical protein [Stylosanthes scabra]
MTEGSSNPCYLSSNSTTKQIDEQLEEKYIADLEALTQEALDEHGGEDGDGTTNPIDPNEVWRRTIGEPNSKNCIYGKGSFFLRATLAATMSPTTFQPFSEEVENQLREKIRELTQNLDERGRSLEEAEERTRVLLARLEASQTSQSAQDLEAIAVARDQVKRDQERIHKMVEDIAIYYQHDRASGSGSLPVPVPQTLQDEGDAHEDDAEDYHAP